MVLVIQSAAEVVGSVDSSHAFSVTVNVSFTNVDDDSIEFNDVSVQKLLRSSHRDSKINAWEKRSDSS